MSQCPNCGLSFKGYNIGGHIRVCGSTNEQLFWRYVEKEDGCWPWTGALHRDGYGRFNFQYPNRRKMRIAHRVAWELTNGEIPAAMHIAHTCDVRNCCNPAHMFLATHAENMADCVAKGRQTKGTRNRHAKMTDEKVIELRKLRAEDPKTWTAAALAKRYGIAPSSAVQIWTRTHWRHLP